MKDKCEIVEEKKEYDLVVIGAGMAGMNAAISAARHNMKVALICAPSVLGGNASVEVGIDINGAAYNSLYSVSGYARETGIIEEIKQTIFNRAAYETYKSASYDGALFDMIYNEKNIDLYLNTYAFEVKMKNKQYIKSIKALQTTTEKHFTFTANYFVDATGDGTIGFLAKAKFMCGSEGYDEFFEGLAPSKHTDFTNGSTLMFQTINTGKEEKFVKPDFAYDEKTNPSLFANLEKNGRIFYKSKRVGGYQGFWWVEFGNDLDVIKDSEYITTELRKIVYGIWNYIKNSGKYEDTWDAKLLHVNSVIGKRESRRFIGETIVSQNDISMKKEYEDNCYMAGWPMDVHANHGIYDLDRPTYWNYVPGMYNLPLSTLYSINIDNLFMCGRNTSCTRVANGSTRVMATCAVAGQAVGIAAYLCKKYHTIPKIIKRQYINQLQLLLLRDDQTIVGYKEEYDLKNVNIECSSIKDLVNEKREFLRNIDKNICISLPIENRLDSFEIAIKNITNEEQELEYDVLTGNRKENYLPENIIYENKITIPANFDDFIKIKVNQEKGLDDKLHIMFKKNDNLQIYMNNNHLTGVLSFTIYEKEPDKRDARKYVQTRLRESVAFRNVLPLQNIYKPENVISGYNRPYGYPNIWISNSKNNEYLKLHFSLKNVEEIHLVFDTDLAEDIIEKQSVMTIKDYVLIVKGDNFTKSFEVNNNFKRINKFIINHEINYIEFIPKDNYGSENYNLFGIKVY